jgi:DNA-binding response OmpR family regulator
VSRDEIATVVWGSRSLVEENNIDVLVKALRRQVDDPFPEKLIQTVRGSGYKLSIPPVLR